MRTSAKIVRLKTLKTKVRACARAGKIIAFTNGCFDILHAGHVKYLEAAKQKNRVLVVGLNSDRSVRSIKGPGRPINPERMRATVLAALACVDFVTIFNEDTPLRLIQAVQPDVLIKGADWKDKGVVGSDVVLARGGRVELIDYVPNISTTGILKKVQKRRGPTNAK